MWWKAVEKLTPSGTTRGDVTGGGSVAIWLAVGLAAFFTILLIVDAILVRDRNKRRLNPRTPHNLMYYIRKFLAWLFYPSFQEFFKSEE